VRVLPALTCVVVFWQCGQFIICQVYHGLTIPHSPIYALVRGAKLTQKGCASDTPPRNTMIATMPSSDAYFLNHIGNFELE
jgi:hypothetical protein